MNDTREDHHDDEQPPPAEQRLTSWQIVGSTLAAAFGVQSSRNRERDFSHGRPVHFIVAGIVFTALFVAGMMWVVSLVLNGAG